MPHIDYSGLFAKLTEPTPAPAVRLENWAVVLPPGLNPYSAPEQITQHLSGDAYGHGRFPDGHPITSTRIVGKRGAMVATRSGSHYLLGTPAADYLAVFPDAEARLMNSLPELELINLTPP